MHARDLMPALRRCWPVVVLGLLVTAGGVWHVERASGVFAGQVNVVFLPALSERANDLNSTTEALISTAGVVARIANGQSTDAQPVSDSVSLSGEGEYDSFSIRLPNQGGQWQYSFNEPVLDVESTGSTLDQARNNMNIALTKVTDTLQTIQRDVGVMPEDMIRTNLSPTEPIFVYNPGSKSRAILALLILGTGFTLAIAVLIDRKLRTNVQPNGS